MLDPSVDQGTALEPSETQRPVASPLGLVEREGYCEPCSVAKDEKQPVAGARGARPQFTIKSFMIVICLWAVPNALVAWVMKSGDVAGTPEQLSQWTIQTFVAVNLVLAFVAGWSFLFVWLIRLVCFKSTDGLASSPPNKRTIDGLPALSEQEQERRTSSRAERLIKAVAVAFGLGWAVVVLIGRDEPMLWEFNDWFPVPRALLVLLVGSLVLMGALALSVRGRQGEEHAM